MAEEDLLQLAARVRDQLTAPGAPFELVDVDVRGRCLRAFRNAAPSLAAFIESGRAHGAKEFMVYEGDRWSFDRFYAAVDALAGRLQADLRIVPGDRVAIAVRNRPEWAVAFAAIAATGAVPAPINSFGMHDELVAALRSVQPRVLFCDADRRDRIGSALGELGITGILVDAAPGPDSGLLDFARMSQPGGPAARPCTVAPDDPGLILFTSGASSTAKPVLSSQRAVCQSLCNIDYIGAWSALTSPQAVAALMASGIPSTTLTAVPLFHVSGLHAQLLTSLHGGRRLVFMHRWNTAKALDLIRSERITQFNGAPAMVLQLLADPGFAAASATLAGVGFGGAGLPQRAIDRLREVRPDSLSGIGFGMTESNGVGAAASGRVFFRQPACSGMLSPIVDVRVVDVDGAPAPPGQPGELWLHGIANMDGYWGNAKATAAALDADGWLRTGDVGFVDTDGYLHVVDRIKDVINRSGEKIAAAEIESCVLQLDAAQEAAVFAEPDPATGEAIAAVVVPRSGATLSADAVRAHVAAQLGPHKAPRTVYVRTTPLPRNPAGKLLKNTLKRDYAAR